MLLSTVRGEAAPIACWVLMKQCVDSMEELEQIVGTWDSRTI